MYHLFGEAVGADIAKLYQQMATDLDIETQQRAVEYIQISKMKTSSPNVVETVLDAMPPFKEGRQNALEDLLRKKNEKSKDQKRGDDGSGGSDDSDSDDDDSDSDNDGSDDDAIDKDASDSSGSDSDSDSEKEENSSRGPTVGSAAGNALGDLLDLGGGSGTVTGSSPDDGSAHLVFDKNRAGEETVGNAAGGAEGIPRKLMPAVLDSFRKACTREKAVLCNDGNLQVGIQQKYKGFEGRVMIYLGNKGREPLERFRAEVEETKHLRWAPNTQRIVSSAAVAPGGNVSLNVRFHTMKPFVSPPQLRISYSVGNKERSYALRLPIVATRFVAPVAMAGPKFVGIFGQIPVAKQAQCVCDAGGSGLHIPQIKALIKSGLRMAICEATANQYVVCGAGSFKTGSKDKAGKPLSVGVLVKLECNPNNNKYRITVRAHHLDVAKAVQTILLNQLKGVDFAPGRGQAKAGPYDGGASGL
jgi:hypothetical protein